MRRLAALAALAALLIALPGCDALDSLLGAFRGTVAVDAAPADVEGEAVYTVVDGPDGPRFVLGLFVGGLTESSRDDYEYVIVRLPGDRPGVGAFAVDDRAAGPRVATATYARVVDARRPAEARGAVLRGTDGTLAVTRVDGYGFLAGTLAFDGVGTRVEAPGQAVAGRASVRFEARYEPPAVFQRLGIAL